MNTAELTRRESDEEELARAPEAPAQAAPEVERVLALQQSAGNASVSRLLGRSPGARPASSAAAMAGDGALSRSLARTAAERNGVKKPNPGAEAEAAVEEPDEFEAEEVSEEEEPQAAQDGPKASGTKLARWPYIPFVTTPTITSKTKLTAPGDPDRTRTTVAVGEKVTFKGSTSGKWTADAGTPAAGAKSTKFVWTAPTRAATATIKLNLLGGSATRTMTVIEPTSITGTKVGSDLTFPAGTQGAGMQLRFTYHPLNVSFGNIKVKEVSGPATNISGYYTKETPADLWHDSGDAFTRIGANNEDTAIDTASFEGDPAPWTDGGWDWVIPNNFRTITENGDGKQFTTVTQSFTLEGPPNDGASQVTKAGVSTAKRKP